MSKKRFYIVKGSYRGEAGQDEPFYSSVLTEEEIRANFDWVDNKESRESMIQDLLSKMTLVEEV